MREYTVRLSAWGWRKRAGQDIDAMRGKRGLAGWGKTHVGHAGTPLLIRSMTTRGAFLYLRRWDGSARKRRGLARESVPLTVRIKTPSVCSYMPSSRGHQTFTSERTPPPRMTRGGLRGEGHMTVCFTCNEAFAEENGAILKLGRGGGKRRRREGAWRPSHAAVWLASRSGSRAGPGPACRYQCGAMARDVT